MATNEELEVASKLLDSFREVGKRRNKSYWWSLGVSSFIILQSLDLIKFDKIITFQWFNIEVESIAFTIIASLLLFFFHQNSLSLITYCEDLEKKITKIYELILEESDIIKTEYIKYLEFPDSLETFSGTKLFRNNCFGKIYEFFLKAFMLIIIPILPLLTLGLALYKNLNESNWILGCFIVMMTIQFIMIWSFYKELD